MNRLLPLIILALTVCGLAGCKSTDRRSQPPATADKLPVSRPAVVKQSSPVTEAPVAHVSTNAISASSKPAKIEKADIAPVPGGEPLAVIVNRKNPVQDLTLEDLRKLCRGETKAWPSGGNVTVAMRDRNQPEAVAVVRQIYQMSDNAFARLLAQKTGSDEVEEVPKELATARHVCRFVFNVPGAIGFVRASEVESSVKCIHVDGLATNDFAYRLRVPGK